MSTDRFNHEVRSFYAGLAPSAEAAQRLVSLAARSQHAAGMRSGLLVRFGGPFLATAAAVLFAIAGYRFGYQAGHDSSGPTRTDVTINTQNAAARSEPVLDTVEPAYTPRLVLMRVHADWCPRCPSIAPIFEEFNRKFSHEPVLFVTFNITNDETRRQAVMLANSLGLFDIIGIGAPDGKTYIRWEPGMLALVDREAGHVVGELRDIQEQPELERRLASVLPHNQPALP